MHRTSLDLMLYQTGPHFIVMQLEQESKAGKRLFMPLRTLTHSPPQTIFEFSKDQRLFMIVARGIYLAGPTHRTPPG